MSMESTDDNNNLTLEEISALLKGKTMSVYWYILKNTKGVTLKQVQIGTKLSTPSLASYHLTKLKELELVKVDNHGVYFLKRDIKVGVLQFFVGSGKLLVPRYAFYSVFYTMILVGYILTFPLIIAPLSILLLCILAFGILTSWIETIRVWRIKI